MHTQRWFWSAHYVYSKSNNNIYLLKHGKEDILRNQKEIDLAESKNSKDERERGGSTEDKTFFVAVVLTSDGLLIKQTSTSIL